METMTLWLGDCRYLIVLLWLDAEKWPPLCIALIKLFSCNSVLALVENVT